MGELSRREEMDLVNSNIPCLTNSGLFERPRHVVALEDASQRGGKLGVINAVRLVLKHETKLCGWKKRRILWID